MSSMANATGKWLPWVLAPSARGRMEAGGLAAACALTHTVLHSVVRDTTSSGLSDAVELWGAADAGFPALRFHLDSSFRRALAQNRVLGFYATDPRAQSHTHAGSQGTIASAGSAYMSAATTGSVSVWTAHSAPPSATGGSLDVHEAPKASVDSLTSGAATMPQRPPAVPSSTAVMGSSSSLAFDVLPATSPSRRLPAPSLAGEEGSRHVSHRTDSMTGLLVQHIEETDDGDDSDTEQQRVTESHATGSVTSGRVPGASGSPRGRSARAYSRQHLPSAATDPTAESFRSQHSDSTSSSRSMISSASAQRMNPGGEGSVGAALPSPQPVHGDASLGATGDSADRAVPRRASPSPSPSEGSHASGMSSRTASMPGAARQQAASSSEYAGCFPLPRLLLWNPGILDEMGRRMFITITRSERAAISPTVSPVPQALRRPRGKFARSDTLGSHSEQAATLEVDRPRTVSFFTTASGYSASGAPDAAEVPDVLGPADDLCDPILETLYEYTADWNPAEWVCRWAITDADLGDRKASIWRRLRPSIAASLPAHQLASLPSKQSHGASGTPLHASLQTLRSTAQASSPPAPLSASAGSVDPLARFGLPDVPQYHSALAELMYDTAIPIIPRYTELMGADSRGENLLRSAVALDTSPRPLTRQQVGQRLRLAVEWSLARASADPRSLVPYFDPSLARCGLLLPLPLDLPPPSDALPTPAAVYASRFPTIHCAAGMFYNADSTAYEVNTVVPLNMAHMLARLLGKVSQPWLKGLSRLGPVYVTYVMQDGAIRVGFNARAEPGAPCVPSSPAAAAADSPASAHAPAVPLAGREPMRRPGTYPASTSPGFAVPATSHAAMAPRMARVHSVEPHASGPGGWFPSSVDAVRRTASVRTTGAVNPLAGSAPGYMTPGEEYTSMPPAPRPGGRVGGADPYAGSRAPSPAAVTEVSPVLLTGFFDGWEVDSAGWERPIVVVDDLTPNAHSVAAVIQSPLPPALHVSTSDAESLGCLKLAHAGCSVVFRLGWDNAHRHWVATYVQVNHLAATNAYGAVHGSPPPSWQHAPALGAPSAATTAPHDAYVLSQEDLSLADGDVWHHAVNSVLRGE